MLAVPTRGQGELPGFGRRLLGDVLRLLHVRRLLLDDGSINDAGVAGSLLLQEPLNHRLEFINRLLLRGDLVA
jgi:hypothetical protein